MGSADPSFGGRIEGNPKTTLEPIRPDSRRGHDVAELATREGIWKTTAAVIDTLIAHIFRHGEEGYPSFNSWPGTDRWTHQQAYKDWLFRAYQGGMRLMVMLAVNSEDEFGRGENELWILDRIRFQRKKVEGRTGNDMEVLDWQIREGYELQKEIDEKAGGYGKVWLANNLVQELVLVGTQQAQQALRGKESVTVKGALAYQTCNDKECFNPVSVFCPGR